MRTSKGRKITSKMVMDIRSGMILERVISDSNYRGRLAKAMAVGANPEIDFYVRIANLEAALFGGPNPAGTALPILGAPVPAALVAGSVIANSVEPPTVLSGSADALPLIGNVVITSAGVDAATLGTPTAGSPLSVAGGQDGNYLWIVAITAQAHTVTTAANKINGNKHIATWTAAVGNNALFYAYNGIWYMISQTGVALT